MQLDLIPRETRRLGAGCVHLPDWLDIERQCAMLTLLRHWLRVPGAWHDRPLPGGSKLAHPCACLGYDWVPYRYEDPIVPMPGELIMLGVQALIDCRLEEFLPYQPETAVVNMFPHGSSLGMHVDRSEAQAVIRTGSPIVTLSLGDTGIFRLGNEFDKGLPYQDIDLRSGDVLVMGGSDRSRYHAITEILPSTAPPEVAAKMRNPGRISITMREVFNTKLPCRLDFRDNAL